MKHFIFVTMIALYLATSIHAQQRGGRPGGGAGGFNPGTANMTRPMPQQQYRPNMAQMQPQIQRPQVSMGGMQGMNRPSYMGQPNNMPNYANRPTTMPQVNQPQVTRPSGGITPGINPWGSGRQPGTPSTLPTTRPSYPSAGNRPTTLPGVGRPTVPDLSRPTTPIIPGGGVINPNVRPGTGTTRPGTLPGVNRPGAGVDTGLDRPTRPTTPPITTLPGTRPGTGQRPVNPPTTRPVINQPINIGNQVNTNINRRPTWVNVNNTTINNINNHWNNAITTRPAMNNWINNNPNRYRYWNNWGNGVRNNWRFYHHHNNWFGHDWWSRYHPGFPGWHYRYWFPYYPYNYWWSVPTWGGVVNWFNWNTPAWRQAVYYDYGMGGNVVYQNNSVYVGGEQVATANDFAQSAALLATVEPPANEEQAAAVEWMPLGTFAMSTGEKDTEPTRIVQLAVTKEGVIGGTLFNTQTQQSTAIQGQVDRNTQRVAFRIGEKDNIVAETGIYNLTQDEAPVLVHFSNGTNENFLFIRLKNEEGNLPK